MAYIKVNKPVIFVVSVLLILTYLVFYRSKYELTPPSEPLPWHPKIIDKKTTPPVQRQDLKATTTANPAPVTVNQKTFPASFILNADYISKISRYNNKIMKTLDHLHSKAIKDGFRNTVNVTKCECGRISDPCICCAMLVPNRLKNSDLQLSTYDRIVKMADNQTAMYCFELVYKPLKESARVSAYLTQINESADANTLISHYKAQNKSLLFKDEVIKNIAEPPELCSGSETVKLCLQLFGMQYKFDNQETSHKTVFIACGRLLLRMANKYIVSAYTFDCFRAHRGAVADQDRKAAVEAVDKTAKNSTNVSVDGKNANVAAAAPAAKKAAPIQPPHDAVELDRGGQ